MIRQGIAILSAIALIGAGTAHSREAASHSDHGRVQHAHVVLQRP